MAIYSKADETEVFRNVLDGIVIRQEGAGEEVFVVLNRDQAAWLIVEIEKLLQGGE